MAGIGELARKLDCRRLGFGIRASRCGANHLVRISAGEPAAPFVKMPAPIDQN
jgi:hypothetical protein